ncbi:MAG TPA: LptE family protein [bacterium]|nr:LptE family protein [bacterium]
MMPIECGNRCFSGSRVFLIALFCVALTAGCGYHLAQRGDKLPEGIKTIAVPVMRNDTTEAGLEAIVSDELRRRFAESEWVELAPVEEADATLVGVIAKFKASPISFSTSDYAVEYRISMRLSVRLVTREGITLWEDHNLVKMREYRQVTDIFDSEANKQEAIRWLAREISADIHDRIFDGFY